MPRGRRGLCLRVGVGVAVAMEVWREEWGKAEAEVALCSGEGRGGSGAGQRRCGGIMIYPSRRGSRPTIHADKLGHLRKEHV